MKFKTPRQAFRAALKMQEMVHSTRSVNYDPEPGGRTDWEWVRANYLDILKMAESTGEFDLLKKYYLGENPTWLPKMEKARLYRALLDYEQRLIKEGYIFFLA